MSSKPDILSAKNNAQINEELKSQLSRVSKRQKLVEHVFVDGKPRSSASDVLGGFPVQEDIENFLRLITEEHDIPFQPFIDIANKTYDAVKDRVKKKPVLSQVDFDIVILGSGSNGAIKLRQMQKTHEVDSDVDYALIFAEQYDPTVVLQMTQFIDEEIRDQAKLLDFTVCKYLSPAYQPKKLITTILETEEDFEKVQEEYMFEFLFPLYFRTSYPNNFAEHSRKVIFSYLKNLYHSDFQKWNEIVETLLNNNEVYSGFKPKHVLYPLSTFNLQTSPSHERLAEDVIELINSIRGDALRKMIRDAMSGNS